MNNDEDAKSTIAKAGKLLCVDAGEYSDYSVVGFFVVLRDFIPDEELAEYRAAFPDQCNPYSFSQAKFLAVLLAKGLLLEVEYGTLFLGGYSDYAEFRFTPSGE